MNAVHYGKIEDQLYELQKACNRYKSIDCLADWVLFAVQRYIVSNKATRQFEIDFVNFPVEKLEDLIKACLNGDRSDDGILRTCRKVFAENVTKQN